MKKLNCKGQTLVEFVLVIPVVIMLIFSSFDFMKILYEKIKLENITNDCLNLMEKDYSYDEVSSKLKKQDNHIKLEVKYQDNNIMNIKLSKEIVVLTPGLNKIIGNPYKISVERVTEYENNK